MAAHELTSLHIQALNSLLESAHTYTINNTPVVLAEASMEHYLGDFAYLAHRLMEMEKFSVLFAIGIMGDRIQVVARSRSDAVNVGDICAELGGGGHALCGIGLRPFHDPSMKCAKPFCAVCTIRPIRTKRRANTCPRLR